MCSSDLSTERNETIIFLFDLWAFSSLFGLKWSHSCIFWFFLNYILFFWSFLLRVRSEGNGKTIFIFSFSRPFPTYFGMKWSHNGIFLFFYFFFSFFGILYFPSGRNGTEIQFLFSLFLPIFQPILAWKEFIMGFFFYFFFAIIFLLFFFKYVLCIG